MTVGKSPEKAEGTPPQYVYSDPEGKADIDRSTPPEPDEDLATEASWHMRHKAYLDVSKADGSSWTKQEVLDAIYAGHADAFTINRFRFPPTEEGIWITEHFPLRFDDVGLGQRVADATLEGFGMDPRPVVEP